MKRVSIFLFLLLFYIAGASELRALWVPSWDISSRSKIDETLKKASKTDFNAVLVEVRYRCDTFYTPNRLDCQFPNPDTQSRLLEENFDALQYILDKASDYDMKVYAWLTMYVATAGEMANNNNNNPWFHSPELFTTDSTWAKMPYNKNEGAFLDPGIPAVQKYLYNVVMDVAVNYEIDGIHLDYIRYPGTEWGYHPLAMERYQKEENEPSMIHWHEWRCRQVDSLVKKISEGLKEYAPEVELTAAVIADPDVALFEYNQNWLFWLQRGYINRVFPMNYTSDQEDFKAVVNKIALYGYKNRTVMGIRAWEHKNGYGVNAINKNIEYIWKKGIWNYALFSSTGMNENNYWDKLVNRKLR